MYANLWVDQLLGTEEEVDDTVEVFTCISVNTTMGTIGSDTIGELAVPAGHTILQDPTKELDTTSSGASIPKKLLVSSIEVTTHNGVCLGRVGLLR